MSRHDDIARLRDMLDYAQRAVRAVKDRKRNELDTDEVLAGALERFVEVVGEAAARVTEDTRDRFPDLPWSQIVGMRNRIVHGYGSVDRDILWQVVVANLPNLIDTLEGEVRGRGG